MFPSWRRYKSRITLNFLHLVVGNSARVRKEEFSELLGYKIVKLGINKCSAQRDTASGQQKFSLFNRPFSYPPTRHDQDNEVC